MPANAFIRLLHHPVKFRLYLLWKLPAAFFSGVRLQVIDEQYCEVTVPYQWFSQNPFRSTYFACLAMAAEMSSGLLAMVHTRSQPVKVSSLVVKFEAVYLKKAVSRTRFVCNDGMLLKAAIDKAVAAGEPQELETLSVGANEAGEKIAECKITWSFKPKS
mgnify:CR=1 FL=1|jgi:hypothetical protein